MLLRRFSKHISDQNWFAVGLDVIVVVVGIFLGMQVTEWNDGRKTTLKEVTYIKQFQTDIEDSIALGEVFRLNNEDLIKATEVLVGMAAWPTSKIDANVFHDNMTSGLYRLSDYRFIRKTWKELISSGQYNQFGDEVLRQLIDRIVERQDQISLQSDNLFVYTQDIIDPWLTENYDMWRVHFALGVYTQQR